MASEVVLVQGMETRISVEPVTVLGEPGAGAVFESLDCIGREISYTGGTATEHDVTTLCSTAKEFRLGLQDPGTMSITGHWVQGTAAHEVIRAAAQDKRPRQIEVVFEDGSIFRALAFVSQRSWSAGVDGVVSATFNFRLTGPTQEVDAP